MPGPALPKPTSLAKALKKLTALPIPRLSPKTRRISLTFADRNAHYSARHFWKEDLPRVAYANPNINYEITRKPHPVDDKWDPLMEVELEDGTTKTIKMTQKHSSLILRELLEVTGSSTTPSPPREQSTFSA